MKLIKYSETLVIQPVVENQDWISQMKQEKGNQIIYMENKLKKELYN